MSGHDEKPESSDVGEARSARGLTLRMLLLTFIFSVFFSIGTIYTLVVLSFSMGVVGVVSVVLASSASIWGLNISTKKKVKPPSSQELVSMSWLSSAFNQSLGTTIVIGGVLLMRYVLPVSAFSGWQRWWFAPAESDLENMVAWLPTILFWMLVVFMARLTVVGIGMKLKRKYIETDELPFPVAEGQADLIKELTGLTEPPTSKLRYFLSGIVFALLFSLVIEHDWDHAMLTPLLATAVGIVTLVGGMNNVFPWKIGKKLPRGFEKVAYYFAYFFIAIGILGLVSLVYAPPDSIFFYLRYGVPASPSPDYSARFINFSSFVPQLQGLGFGISVSILLFVIGYLIPSDTSSGILTGSAIAFILIPVGLIGLTGSLSLPYLYSIDSSLVLAALLSATIVGSIVVILRTILTNREGAKNVILRGVKELYVLGRTKRSKGKGIWSQYLLLWVPLTVLTLITVLVVGIEPSAPWYLTVIIVFFAFVITPFATTLGTWVSSRTTRLTSQSPLPFLYEATLFGTGVRELAPYAFGTPAVWQAQGLLSQMRVAHLTKTESKLVYWADLIGFPLLGVLASSLICIWVFSAFGAPGVTLSSPGGTGAATPVTQWNFNPIWSVLYTFIVWVANGGGVYPFACCPITFFLIPLIILSAWTILHGMKRIPIASIAGIAVGFAVMPYMAITISLGTLTAAVIRRVKGIDWFARNGTALGAGIYAGACISLFMLVIVVPLVP
ncbi:MAG: OPT/YSL family transporter [Candidatus Atabeyarchaeum deiterrae]